MPSRSDPKLELLSTPRTARRPPGDADATKRAHLAVALAIDLTDIGCWRTSFLSPIRMIRPSCLSPRAASRRFRRAELRAAPRVDSARRPIPRHRRPLGADASRPSTAARGSVFTIRSSGEWNRDHTSRPPSADGRPPAPEIGRVPRLGVDPDATAGRSSRRFDLSVALAAIARRTMSRTARRFKRSRRTGLRRAPGLTLRR